MTRILHVSDLHFGWPAMLPIVDALDALMRAERYDVVAVSGDLSQRSKAGEFQRALVFLRHAAQYSQTISVPGNHDVAWWFAPLGVGAKHRLYQNYQRWISPTLEPVLHAPGVTLVGINTAHGVAWDTLTGRPRDVSIVGSVRQSQIDWAATQFRSDDARVIVMHHNPTFGALSQRYGITRPKRAIEALSAINVNLVLCGHDHQEAIVSEGRMLISVAGTVSSRSRGHRPQSVNVCTVTRETVEVQTLVWNGHGFEAGAARCVNR
ncbi:MAG TPA: metallophosphoesterase [Gemmatimonadaceae bacterium]|nr:metallophosphoesterase [Gemmatimonadaceae bacterium]